VAISNRRVAFDVPSPGGEGQGEGGLSLTPSMLVANNTVENPHNSKAKYAKNTVEIIWPLSVKSVVESPSSESKTTNNQPLTTNKSTG